ncbi:hypothetical protein [Streptomyces sp. NPDC046805]|uniref:hypothetical protein n=1 Tax=Streptomyces sp. NPDC046805 TaxID=3155134 RepID=UPI003406179E
MAAAQRLNGPGVNLQICGHPAQADELIVQGGLTDFDAVGGPAQLCCIQTLGS